MNTEESSNTISVENKLKMLESLRWSLLEDSGYWKSHFERAQRENPWFTQENINQSVNAICTQMLDRQELLSWISKYQFSTSLKNVGIIMAGNLPLVGFGDWLAVFLSGHHAQVKLSDKDAVLLPALISYIEALFPDFRTETTFVSRLQNYDAIIATGSNNSAVYFEEYFSHVPHIIRKNRTSVGVLYGDESDTQLTGFWSDINDYFGMGCRSVSKIYLPVDYDIPSLFKIWDELPSNKMHNKYMNNYDYNLSICMLNKSTFYCNDALILIEDKRIFSRLSTVHFEYYDDANLLAKELQKESEQIQCVVSQKGLDHIQVITPGTTQLPGLEDYADGVDTMEFLSKL